MTDINLADVLQSCFSFNIGHVHTSLPAIVKSFDATAGTVSAKPSIKKLLSNGKTIDLPILKDIPIVFPCGQSGGITFKVESGDGVILIFSERSLDEWKAGNTDSKPQSSRKFDLSDAFAIPCIYPKKNRSRNKYLKAQNGTMVTGLKVFVGDPAQPKTGAVVPVSVDVVAILAEVLDILGKLLTPGALISAAPASPVVIPPPLSLRLGDLTAYLGSLKQIVLNLPPGG